MNGTVALKQYQQMGAHGAVMDATPHRLIQMLLNGAITRILSAKGHMERNQLAQKGEQISSAISIVDGLRNSLDFEKGGAIARNLDDVYEYVNRILLQANISNELKLLDEAGQLLSQIKGAWDALPQTGECEF